MRNSLSFKNIFKREMKLASYMIICLTIVVISLSYAMFFQVNENTTNQEVIAGELKFTYTDGSLITSQANNECFFPTNELEANINTNTCSYTFSVTNTGTLSASYTLKLLPTETNTMDDSKIKVILKKQVGDIYKKVIDFPKKVSDLQEGILLEENLKPQEVAVYNAQIFVDESAFEDTDRTKKIAYKIEGTGYVHENSSKDEVLAVDYLKEIAKTNDDFAYDHTTDNNLRYIGVNPNNYIDIGDKDSEGNVIPWRIIGVMNNIDDGKGNKDARLKVIRSESIGEYSWDTTDENINWGEGINEWSQSKLMKLLNPGYESENVGGSLYWNKQKGKCYVSTHNGESDCDFTTNGLSTEAKNVIDNVVWNTASNTKDTSYDKINTGKIYELEKSNNTGKICTSGLTCNDTVARSALWKGYIGLLTPSDYSFATKGGDKISRETCLNEILNSWKTNKECSQNSWLYIPGKYQWTITTFADSSIAFLVFYVEDTSISADSSSNKHYVSPTAYLKPNVKIIDGDGSIDNMYKIG